MTRYIYTGSRDLRRHVVCARLGIVPFCAIPWHRYL